jgi:hypothetical protein
MKHNNILIRYEQIFHNIDKEGNWELNPFHCFVRIYHFHNIKEAIEWIKEELTKYNIKFKELEECNDND